MPKIVKIKQSDIERIVENIVSNEIDQENSIAKEETTEEIDNQGGEQFMVAKSEDGKKILHSSHVDLEPTSTTPQIKQIIQSAGYEYLFTENIETKKTPLKGILKMYQDCDYVVTTRLHGAIIAYAFKRPYIAISFDPKITAFNKLYGGGRCITDLNQLKQALAGDQFKAESDYQRELSAVRNFGALYRSQISG
mgnify:CR=1 FL=1